MKIVIYIFLFFILLFSVNGNTLKLYEQPILNKTIAFYFYHSYNDKHPVLWTVTDELGRFNLSNYRLSDDYSREDLILVAIGDDLKMVSREGRLFRIDGNLTAVGFFPAIEGIEKLNIEINTVPIDSLSPQLTLMCYDENLYFCSLAFAGSNEGLIQYESFFPNRNGTLNYTFQTPFNMTFQDGFYYLSALVSDYSNVVLRIGKYKTQIINVTNPNTKKSKVIVETVEPYCSFIDGGKKKEDILKPHETKKYTLISINVNDNCTTKNSFVDVDLTVQITIISISTLAVGIYLFRKSRKNKKDDE